MKGSIFQDAVDERKTRMSHRLSEICRKLTVNPIGNDEEKQQVTLALMYAAYLKLLDVNVLNVDPGVICTDICKLLFHGDLVIEDGHITVRGVDELKEATEILLKLREWSVPVSFQTAKTINDFLSAIKKSGIHHADKTTSDNPKS